MVAKAAKAAKAGLVQWHHCNGSDGMGMAVIATVAEMAVNAVAEEVDCYIFFGLMHAFSLHCL